MQALVYEDGRLNLVSDYPKPTLEAGEALVKVSAVGICATDLEITKGYLGFNGIPGHEFVGIVEESDVSGWRGKRVVGNINVGCGHCVCCLAERAEHCESRTVLGIVGRNGAFAEYLTLPVTNLHLVPEKIDDNEAVFVEPLAAALRIREQVKVSPSADIAVVGPGRLGLLVAQVLRLIGNEVTVLGRSSTSLSFAETFRLRAVLVEDGRDDSFDLVVEATGNAAGFAHSLRLVKPQGTVILKSTFAQQQVIDLTKIVVSEVNIVGSRCGPFAPALRVLSQGEVQVRPLIEAEYPLGQALQAFEHASRPGAKKIIVHT